MNYSIIRIEKANEDNENNNEKIQNFLNFLTTSLDHGKRSNSDCSDDPKLRLERKMSYDLNKESQESTLLNFILKNINKNLFRKNFLKKISNYLTEYNYIALTEIKYESILNIMKELISSKNTLNFQLANILRCK